MTTRFPDARQTNVTDLIQRLDDCATVVTGNRRLARALVQAFNRAKSAEGNEAWPAPDILPWEAWLQRLWQEAIISGQVEAAQTMLLTPHQEFFVWQGILKEHLGNMQLQAANETVNRLMDAWQMLQAWHIPRRKTDFSHNADTRLFWRLVAVFEAKCREHGWLSLARLPSVLAGCVQAGNLQLPCELVLTGFDEWAPQQSSLLDMLDQAGCAWQWLQLSGQPARIGKLACADSRDEIRLAAHWIRQHLAENPAVQIALVVPELAAQREMICQTLDEVLIPQALQPGQHTLARPYNLSLGRPLNRYPPVSLALDALDLSAAVIELPHASRVLRSSFIAGGDREMGARALLDARLREAGEWNLTVQKLLAEASQGGQSYSCPLLAQHLTEFSQRIQQQRTSARPGEWAQRFEQWLKAIGWPGERGLSSEEYQVIQAWQKLLREFAALDWVTRPISLDAALEQLRHMVASTVFQPESAEAPVQVLGLFEASGLQFDHLWIMGLHDGVFPAPPRPNPFLPLILQRKADAPHSSAGRELRVAEALLQRITASAADVVISYPQRNGDEMLDASPLIKDFPALDKTGCTGESLPAWRESIYRSRQQVVLSEDSAPAFAGTMIPGGSRMFKLQAACPFLAFAELRLGARPLGRIQTGLTALVRGSLLHRVMETIWGELDSSAALIALSVDELGALVADKVNDAIQEIAPRYPHTFGQRLQVLESRRLHALVLAWLEVEKQRPPFRVSGREKKTELELDGVRIRVKIDRIDTLAEGGELLIDYKTGEVKAAAWFGDRPDEPQLPLYSLAFTDELAGMAFARIRAGEADFNGVAREEVSISGVKSFGKLKYTREAASWDEVLASWRQTIERLAQDFLAGEAGVNPKQYPQTCTYCELKPLCRIGESLEAVEDKER